jgi:hypothetical protein
MKPTCYTCNVSILDALIKKKINALGVDNYQVLVKNAKGYNGLNNAVWPGYNLAIVMQIPNNTKAAEVMEAIREFNKLAFNDNEQVTAALPPMEDYYY